MYLTLALVVLIGSIVVFFIQEFIGVFKRIFEIKGALLLIPLAAASWAVYTFDYWVLWGLTYYREILQSILAGLLYIIPFQTGANILATILLLTFVSVVPVFALDFILRQKTFKAYPYPYVTSTIILLISTCTLLVVWPA